jgi:hypothetical protein
MVYFRNKNSKFWLILECLAMKDVGKFYGHLVYFVVILVCFSHFGVLYQKIWHHLCRWTLKEKKNILQVFYCFFGMLGMRAFALLVSAI